MSRNSRRVLAPFLISLIGAGAPLPGCVGYTTYEPAEGDRVEGEYLNRPAMRAVLSQGLRFALERLPPSLGEQEARLGELGAGPSSPVPVSLPRGLTQSQHDAIMSSIADLARPLGPEDSLNDVYRVGDVRVRGSIAWVDIHRPVDVPDDRARTPYQCVTVELRNRIVGWRVEDYQVWRPDAVPLPSVNVLTPVQSEHAGAPPTGQDDR